MDNDKQNNAIVNRAPRVYL